MEKIIANFERLIINPIIGLLFALATIMFLWGALEFIKSDGDRDRAKQHLLWSVVGFFIMVSFYGLIRVICATLGVACR